LAQADQEIAEMQKGAQAELDAYCQEQKELADKDIASLKAKAQQDIALERQNAVEQMRDEVVDVALKLTEELLEKEISEEDNSKLIEQCLEAWGGNHD
jgi:F-type H+-transporting ATPase subunit b